MLMACPSRIQCGPCQHAEAGLLKLPWVDETPKLGSERAVRTSQAKGLGTTPMLQKVPLPGGRRGVLRPKKAEPAQVSHFEGFVPYLERNGKALENVEQGSQRL